MLLAALTGGSGGTVIDGASHAITSGYAEESLITNSLYNFSYDYNAPMAFINLLFIPEKAQGSIHESHFAFDQINGGAQQVGTSIKAPHDLMQINDFEVKEKGVVIVYLSNESAKFTEVFFDELKVTVNEHAVIQADDYYPFGLTFNSFKRTTNTENKYLYNSKELQDELGLGWIDYGWRNYDPSIGNWHSVDNLAEKYPSSSPYHYAGNNPILNYDIDGNEFTESAKKWAKKLWVNVNGQIEKNNNKIGKKMAMVESGIDKKGNQLSEKKTARLANQVSKLQENNSQLAAVQNEIIALDNSSQVYDVVSSDKFSDSQTIRAGAD